MCQELINHFWKDSTLNHLLTKRWTLKSFPFHLSQATHPPPSVLVQATGGEPHVPRSNSSGSIRPSSAKRPSTTTLPSALFWRGAWIEVCRGGDVFPNPFQDDVVPVRLNLKGIPTNKNADYKSLFVLF